MTRLQATGVNAAQIESWNGAFGNIWAGDTFRERQNRAQGPFGDAAIEALGLQPGHHVLDIGCGSGSTTFALANRVGPSGRVVGIDISAPQLANATKRAEALANRVVEFHHQDVTAFPFAAGTFDRAFSRFGVMFFADFSAAFRNLASALAPGGRLAFVCWRRFEENPWFGVSFAALREVIPGAPGPAEGPGPMALADPVRTGTLLQEAGFREIAFERFDAQVDLGPNLASAVHLAMNSGPTGRALPGTDPATRAAVREKITAALEPHLGSAGVSLPGATWLVTARR